MSNSILLADSVAHFSHLRAFEQLIKLRLSEIQLDKILVYLVDTVDSAAIPYLADQLDVLGYKGFRLAYTDAEKRTIIKRSIQLHRYKGTLWAVKESLKSIGFSDAVVTEHVADHWANFRVNIDLGERSLEGTEVEDLVKMILEYKNARSHLVDVTYTITLGSDELTLTDFHQDYHATTDNDTVFIGSDFRHDGKTLRNGARNYSLDADVLQITVLIE